MDIQLSAYDYNLKGKTQYCGLVYPVEILLNKEGKARSWAESLIRQVKWAILFTRLFMNRLFVQNKYKVKITKI